MGAYYNEFDPKAAAWLRELIRQGHIAPGDVDERSIEDVTPNDLKSYTQCHFFAGIGVWSYALSRAGWPDDRPVWTGSCPCQPFSAAGKGGGFDDERHLWPAWHWLVAECRPAVIFGEQVASKDAEPWLDLVQADLEALAYAVGAEPYPSAGVGAPHIRDRLYWVADSDFCTSEQGRSLGSRCDSRGDAEQGTGLGGGRQLGSLANSDDEGPQGRSVGGFGSTERAARSSGVVGRLADPDGRQFEGQPVLRGAERDGADSRWSEGRSGAAACGADSGLADATAARYAEAWKHKRRPSQLPARSAEHGRVGGLVFDRAANGAGAPRGYGPRDMAAPAGPVNGLWRDADWLFCRDGKWRPVEPGTFPLAHGAPARVGRLRGYGNAINAEAAVAWIESYLDAEAAHTRGNAGLELEDMLA